MNAGFDLAYSSKPYRLPELSVKGCGKRPKTKIVSRKPIIHDS